MEDQDAFHTAESLSSGPGHSLAMGAEVLSREDWGEKSKQGSGQAGQELGGEKLPMLLPCCTGPWWQLALPMSPV